MTRKEFLEKETEKGYQRLKNDIKERQKEILGYTIKYMEQELEFWKKKEEK